MATTTSPTNQMASGRNKSADVLLQLEGTLDRAKAERKRKSSTYTK